MITQPTGRLNPNCQHRMGSTGLFVAVICPRDSENIAARGAGKRPGRWFKRNLQMLIQITHFLRTRIPIDQRSGYP